MSILEISNNLFFIERGYLNANHFVYRSERPVLIDTAYSSGFEETERLLASLGVDLSAVGLIINTHCHGDHIGGNRTIQNRSCCDIAVHRYGKHFIETRDDWATWWKYYDKKADFFSCTRTLNDGEMIRIGPHEFRVIHTPGHSADGIVLYHQKEKILLSSDTLWEDNLAVLTLRIEGSGALFSTLESLEKIESLDVRTVYPGHGRPFTAFREAISKSKKRVANYMQNREAIGMDLLKKMMVFNILKSGTVEHEGFFSRLMATHWFPETVDLYFDGRYDAKYEEVMNYFLKREILRRDAGRLHTTVKP